MSPSAGVSASTRTSPSQYGVKSLLKWRLLLFQAHYTLIAIPAVAANFRLVTFCIRLATVLANQCIDETPNLDKSPRPFIPFEELLTLTNSPDLQQLLPAADQVVSDLRNVNVVKVSKHKTAAVRWHPLTATQMRAAERKEHDLLTERHNKDKTFGQLVYVGVGSRNNLQRFVVQGATPGAQAGGLLLLVVAMISWVDRQIQREGLSISTACQSPAVSSIRSSLECQGKAICEACEHAVAAQRFSGNFVSRKKHQSVLHYPGNLRELAKRDMVLTEMKYALSFSDLRSDQLKVIFQDANEGMAEFYQWTMVNLTYQRAVRIFSDGQSGQLPYPPLNASLARYRRQDPKKKSDLEQLDMKCGHHDGALSEALQFDTDDQGAYKIEISSESLQESSLPADSKQGLVGLCQDLGSQMTTILLRAGITADLQDGHVSY